MTQGLGHLLATPAVAQGDGDGAFGAVLADDVLIEFGDDFSGGHVGSGHNGISSVCGKALALGKNHEMGLVAQGFDDVILVGINT